MSEGGARGRTTDRIREIEVGKAEAKFAGKLKEQAAELKRAEKEINDMQEQGEKSQRLQEMKAKQVNKVQHICGRTLGGNTCGIRFEFASIGSQEGVCLAYLNKASV